MLAILTTVVIIGLLLAIIFGVLGLSIFLWPLYLDIAVIGLIILICRRNKKKNG